MSGTPVDPRSFHVPATPSPETAVPSRVAPAQAPDHLRRRRRWPRVMAAIGALCVVVVGFFSITAWSSWRSVDRVDLADVLEPSPTATNYLIVGTDSRAGVDADNTNAGVIFGEGDGGERTDTVAVLRIERGSMRLLAIPRDLYVDIGGGRSRINAAFARGGARQLVTTVQRELGIGIDHYLEVDFAGFLALVDALGGVTLDFAHPAYDHKSGLLIERAGPAVLDSDAALAYVRSRSYTEIIDGRPVTDPTADLGRVERQQRFLAAVFAALGDTRNPFTLLEALDGISDNVRVDDAMSFRDVIGLGWALRGADPAGVTVPTVPHTTPGGAQVLLLDGAKAAALLAEFR